MTLEDYKKKSQYLRSIGQTATADDYDMLIRAIEEIEPEFKRLHDIEREYNNMRFAIDLGDDY